MPAHHDPHVYTIWADPADPTRRVLVVGAGRTWMIDAEAADPEHRHLPYRLAGGWFGNLPAGPDPTPDPPRRGQQLGEGG